MNKNRKMFLALHPARNYSCAFWLDGALVLLLAFVVCFSLADCAIIRKKQRKEAALWQQSLWLTMNGLF